MSESPRQTLPVGTRIGVYEIRRVLGVGHTGITYQAWNQHLNSEMVLKEYFPHGLATRADDGCTAVPNSEADRALFEFGLERFLVEAEDLISMEHPNVVRVQNSLQNYATAYQIMEHEKGVSLEKLIERPDAKLDEDQLKLILLPLLDALEKVHRVGFVHGDINPSNILLKADGEPVLLNFASTRLAMARSRGELAEVLSEAYAPPEQFEALDNYGPQTDLYALGTTMYYCIMGKAPLPARERLSAVNRGESDPLDPIETGAAPGFSDGFLKGIDMMMRLKVEQRPKSTAEVVEKLSGTIQENVNKIGKDAVKEVVGSQDQPDPSRPRSPLILMAVSVLGVVALITTAFWYIRQDDSSSDIAESDNTGAVVVADRQDVSEFEKIESKVSPPEGHARGQELEPPTHGSQIGNSSQITDMALEPGTTPGPVQATVPVPTASTTQTASEEAEKTLSGSFQAELPTTASEKETPSEERQSGLLPPAQVSLPIKRETQGPIAEKTIKEGDAMEDVTDMAQRTQPESSKVNEVTSPLDESSPDLSARNGVGSESKPEEKKVSAIEPSPEEVSDSAQISLKKLTVNQADGEVVQKSQEMAGQHEDLENLVAKRMASAETDLSALRLTTPKGENALENYQAILEKLPNHSGALAGIQRIVDIYAWLIENAINEGELAVAELYLTRAEEISPRAPSLIRARQNLSAAQTSAPVE